MRPVFREELDAGRCHKCEADGVHHHGPLTLTGRCHPGIPVYAAYAEGCIALACAKCNRPVALIPVASEAHAAELELAESQEVIQ
jgi:hypothetical protein